MDSDTAVLERINNIELLRIKGRGLAAVIDQMAGIRIEVFRAFPYLYQGSMEYERSYLQTYIDNDDAILIGAFDDGKLIGAATALPLSSEEQAFKQPFIDNGIETDPLFYFAESVLLPEYRGQGLGVAFFKHREAYAASFMKYRSAVFCAVQRPDNHPLRPNNYQSLEAFWRKRGFSLLDGVQAQYGWQDIDQPSETDKSLQFWIKSLVNNV